MSKRTFALFLTILLLASTVPSATANNYKGYQLSRSEVTDFSLIDQNGDQVNLHHGPGEILVVAFIFTTCPDVCSIITQSLKSVQQGLGEEYAQDVEFMSITVDPEYDTPERLKEYTQLHDVNWSHLTGDLAELEKVWKEFGLVVQKNVIEAHVGEGNGYQSNDSTLMLVDGNGNSSELMFLPTAWTLTHTLFESNNVSLNYSTHSEYGNMISGINDVESPSDWSWYWKFMTFNESTTSWQESPVGVDFVDSLANPHIAYLASNANEGLLVNPGDGENPSISVVYPQNTTQKFSLEENMTAWHLTTGAFDGAGINYSSTNHPQFGHFFSSINDEDPAQDNFSWYWELHTWNESSISWEYSMLGVDSIYEPKYIAWARNTTNDSDIPIPGAVQNSIDQQAGLVCNGHGWEMGSGDSKHCMCDGGYEWPEDSMLSCVEVEADEQYSVGHSTTTFILDRDRKPRVAWTGDRWAPEDFISDIEMLAEDIGLIEKDTESEDRQEGLLPGPSIALALSALGLAAITINIRSKSNGEER